MIARQEPCDASRLTALLHRQLEHDDEMATTAHLDRCEHCRAELDRLAASDAWWQETRDNLRQLTSLSLPPTSFQGSNPGVTASEARHAAGWVVGMLAPDASGSSLGLLDGRAVRDVVGQGGMGVVLKVWDEELHRPLAVKLLSPLLSSHGASRQRFYREAQAAAAVVHPNIVPIFAVTSTGPLPYLVMPYIAGGNLQQRIDREGPLPLADVLSIGLQIAEGLGAAHRQGLVHRDIKPANILLDEGGHRVMLSDFGLARALDDATITASGMIAGTPHYMSPEQARGETVDCRSDLYSLGAVLYAMATGRPPVRGETTLAVLRRVGEERPTPVHEINEAMPLWMHRVMLRIMEKDPRDRIADAEGVAELLRGCLAHVRAPGRNPLPERIAMNDPRRFLVPFIAISAVLVVLFFAGILAVLNGQGARVNSTRIPEGDARGKATPKAIPADWSEQAIETNLWQLESMQRSLQQEIERDLRSDPIP